MSAMSNWKDGFRDGLPIFMGYVAVSFTFGIAAQSVLKPLQAVLMSASNYTSAGQFAALGLIAAACSLVELAAVQLVVNMRYSLMSCFISQKLEPGTPTFHRVLMAVGLTDEVFGVCAASPGRLKPSYAYGVMSAALPGWVLGTFLGVISQGMMPPRAMSALGIAIYGMFIAIVFPPVRKNSRLALVVLASMLGSALFDKISLLAQVTPGFKIIILTVGIAGTAAALFPLEKKDPATDSSPCPAPRGGQAQGSVQGSAHGSAHGSVR